MPWRPVQKSDLEKLIPLLVSQEPECISFAAQFLDWYKPRYLAHQNRFVIDKIPCSPPTILIQECNRVLNNSMMITNSGTIFPSFSAEHALTLSDLEADSPQALKCLQNSTKIIHSILGTKSAVNQLESLISIISNYKRKPYRALNYDLMLLTKDDFIPSGEKRAADWQIHRANKNQADLLFELEKKYQKEEVLLDPRNFDFKNCQDNLHHTLQSQYVYYASLNKKPVAKAGTNALGFVTAQIGGVFTEPEFRNRGISCALMSHLLAYLFEYKKQVCLFVKKTNLPARKLYANLGFKTINDYRISYYSRS